MYSLKDKHVECRRTGGASMAEVLCEKRIMGCFGHMTRRNEKDLEMDILYSEVPSSCGRRRSPIRWAEIIKA